MTFRLPSARTLLARADAATPPGEPYGSDALTVIVMDVDRVPELTCRLGSEVKRQVLDQVARRLCGATKGRPNVEPGTLVVGRAGESTFAVVSVAVGPGHDPVRIAAHLQELLAAPYPAGGTEIRLSCCCGIARASAARPRAVEAYDDALAALSEARRRGDGSRVLFDESLRAELASAFDTDNALRAALDDGALTLHFQPIVFLDSCVPQGCEALLRWHRQDGVLVSPESFIGVAERGDLIVQLDRWVLAAACRQIRSWQTRRGIKRDVTVSVNISGAHFGRPDLIATIDGSLRAAGIYGRSLEVEITESAMIANPELTRAMLTQLRALGIRVSIDDFGTGYSSLAALRRLDVDTLKIDRSFVSRVPTDPESREIVRTIVALAAGLGKRVVAEGIETGEQAEAIRSLGCRLGQGYYFGEPMDAESATRYMAAADRGDLFTT